MLTLCRRSLLGRHQLPLQTAGMASLADEFAQRVALGKTLPPLSDNTAKLEMYALFKQANVGPNTTSRPGMLDFVGRAKWDAWSKLGAMTPDEAKQKYVVANDSRIHACC